MTISDWLTLVAIVLGPVFGVALAQYLQDRTHKRERRMEIFRTLMRTRRTPMWLDHVGALNLVEIEFARNQEVIDAWRKLFKHLGNPHARRPEEAVTDGMSHQDIGDRDRRYYERLGNERQRLLAKLLHAIAKVLDFKVEQLEIFEGGYTPQGWADIELDQTVIRRFAAQIASGQRALPVLVFSAGAAPTETGEPGADSGSETA